MRIRGPRVLAAVAVVLAVAGSTALAAGWPEVWPGPAGTAARAPATDALAPADHGGRTPPAPAGSAPLLGRSVPVSLDIAAIGVHVPLHTLGLAADGTVEVPPLESREAGWYRYSPTPGELGPSVVLGHVDSARSGPGVFVDLHDVRPGDAITVGRQDGSTATFRVDRVARYPKAAFPTAEVYGDVDHAGLRLITCGGAFDPAARSYLDNVVVFASAVADPAPEERTG